MFNTDILKKDNKSKRPLQIGKEIKVILSEVLMKGKFKDPDLFDLQIAISSVEVSKDLTMAKVYVSFWNSGQNIEQILKTLNKNRAFFRHKVGQSLQIKVIPILHFYQDIQVDKLNKIQKILDTIK